MSWVIGIWSRCYRFSPASLFFCFIFQVYSCISPALWTSRRSTMRPPSLWGLRTRSMKVSTWPGWRPGIQSKSTVLLSTSQVGTNMKGFLFLFTLYSYSDTFQHFLHNFMYTIKWNIYFPLTLEGSCCSGKSYLGSTQTKMCLFTDATITTYCSCISVPLLHSLL